MTIIHISGTPGSGKTTLGEKIQKQFGNKVVVYDTDEFIQHHTKEGKILLKLEEENVPNEQYLAVWKEILDFKFKKFIASNPNKIIIFTGMLDNFSPDGTIYKLDADYKFMLDVPIEEILKRYYTRICNDDKNRSPVESEEYWTKIADKKYTIDSSVEKVNAHKKDVIWHQENGYELLSDKEIINKISSIINS